jgi:23S rRNA (adenine-N6)-dimethyltransferase
VQWELARKRATVWPSTLRGVYWRAWYELDVTRHLAPNSFAPPPSVDAGVLSVRRRAAPLVPVEHARAYLRLLELAFNRQPPLRRVFDPRELKRAAVVLGFSPDATARDLDAHQWAALFAATRSTGSAGTRGARGTRSRRSR